MRMFGIPAVQFWSTVLQREYLKLYFHEDNQTMIRVMQTGRNFSMRYATRTLRLPIGWMHERFQRGDLMLRYEVTARMAADIFTKAFTDEVKFTSACWLINIVDPEVLRNCIKHITYDEPPPVEFLPKDEDEGDLFPVKGKSVDSEKGFQHITSDTRAVSIWKMANRKLVTACVDKCRQLRSKVRDCISPSSKEVIWIQNGR